MSDDLHLVLLAEGGFYDADTVALLDLHFLALAADTLDAECAEDKEPTP